MQHTFLQCYFGFVMHLPGSCIEGSPPSPEIYLQFLMFWALVSCIAFLGMPRALVRCKQTLKGSRQKYIYIYIIQMSIYVPPGFRMHGILSGMADCSIFWMEKISFCDVAWTSAQVLLLDVGSDNDSVSYIFLLERCTLKQPTYV